MYSKTCMSCEVRSLLQTLTLHMRDRLFRYRGAKLAKNYSTLKVLKETHLECSHVFLCLVNNLSKLSMLFLLAYVKGTVTQVLP